MWAYAAGTVDAALGYCQARVDAGCAATTAECPALFQFETAIKLTPTCAVPGGPSCTTACQDWNFGIWAGSPWY
jgi:hypothetical protein